MPGRQDVVFRGSKEGLEILLNGVQDFGVLKEKLRDHLRRAESFFQVSDIVLNTGDATLSLDEILEIQNMLAYPYGLRLKKIVHSGSGTPRQSESAPPHPGPGVSGTSAPATPRRRTREDSGGRSFRVERLPRASSGSPDTLLYKGTLRSGQRIDHNGNVVVVGDVNPGAEVTAAGDIVVMGALRGLAHAGAGGVPGVVVASRFEPTQLRIGDVIGRPPERDARSGREPEVAKLKDGVILIEPLEGTRWEGER